MERSSFFDATLVGETYDRVYLAEDFARYFSSFIGNGVFPTPSSNLQVVQDVNMQVKVKAGKGWINGYFYDLTEDLVINVDIADGVLKRIDRVVVRLDFINREIKAYLKKGTFASSPIAPALTRTADIYELGIADILINNGVTSIVQANITDLRQNNTYCGLVAGVVQQIDTTNLFAQFQTAFDVWFEAVKGQLSTDAAGNLQNQIDLIQPLVDSWEDFKGNGGTLFNSLTINNLNTLTDQIKTSKNNLTIGLEGTSTGYNLSKTSFAPNFLSIGDNPVLGRIEYPWQDLILRDIGSARDAIIVASGSNANGSYVKFGDGTMICYRNYNLDVTITTNQTVAMPATFIDSPSTKCALIATSVSSTITLYKNLACMTSATSWVLNLSTAGSGTMAIRLSAIGRWK